MKLKFKNILFLLIGTIIFMIPTNLFAAADFETSFVVYKYDAEKYGKYTNRWLTDFRAGKVGTSADQLASDASLEEGDTIVVGTKLLHKGSTSKMIAFMLYYKFDENIFEPIISDPDYESSNENDWNGGAAVQVDMRQSSMNGVFDAPWRSLEASVVDNLVGNNFKAINTVGANSPYKNTKDQPFTFTFFKVKSGVTPGQQIKFEFINDKWSSTETLGSDNDENEIPIDMVSLTTMKIKEEEVVLSTDNTLSEVKAVYNGTDYVATYDEPNKTYSIVLPAGANSATLYATRNDTKSTLISTHVSETGTSQTINVGTNNFTATVNAEDTTVDAANYKIIVKRLDNTAGLETLTLSDITIPTPGFSPTTYTYNITVPFKTTSTTVSATLPTSNTTAKITGGTGAWNLTNTGATINTQKVRVESETCKAEYASVVGNSCEFKEYTINITRTAPDTDSSLSGLEVKPNSTGTAYTMTPTFSSGTLTGYKVKVPFETTSVYIEATATSPLVGSVTGTGNKPLSGNSTQADIIVTAESGAKSTYTVTIEKELSNDATLTALSVNGTAVPGFTANTEDYSTGAAVIEVNGNISSVTVDYTKGNQYSTVTPTSKTISLANYGDNIITISVTSQDGTSTKNYKFKVYKKSNNVNLQGLTVTSNPQGTLNPVTFNPTTKTYTYTYDESVTGITIAATKGETHQTITGEKTYDPKTETSATIGVTAEDGTTNSYTVNFTRKTSTDNTLSSVVVEYNDTSNVKQTVTLTQSGNTFTGTVPYEAKIVNVVATPTSNVTQSVTGNGTWTLSNTGTNINTRTVTVTAESGAAANYTLNVTRTPSDNNFLSDIKLNGTTITGFNRNTTSYTVADVKSNVGSLSLTYTKENEDANATILNNTLTPGNNTVTIRVTAQNGTTKDYEIHVKKLSGDATATGLTITATPTNSANGLTESFSTTKTNYTYKYDRNTTNFDINLTLPTNATISSTTKTSYTKAEIDTNNVVTVTVLAEDTDVTKDYIITFEQIKETDNKLTTLTVKNTTDGTNYSLTPTFGETNGGPYNVTVPSDVENVTITTTLSGDYTKGITITGGTFTQGSTAKERTIDINLTPGSNSKTITVTAEDDSTKTYTLNITRTINADATLSDLTIDGTTAAGFASGTTTYDLGSLPYATTSIELGATPTVSTGTTVTGTGTKNLSIGPNSFDIDVTAASGAKGKYTVTARRKSNVSTLTGITTNVAGATVRSTGTNEYTIDIPAGTTSISLTPNLTDSTYGSLVTPTSDITNIDLTTITEKDITVAAEDTDAQYNTTYKVKFNVLESTNVFLGSLTVDQGTLDPTFDRETYLYNVEVETNVENITITATPEDTLSTVSGDTGVQNLDYGPNTFTITVTAENNDTQDYTIIVTRKKKNINTLTEITIDGNPLPGFDPGQETYNITVPEGTTSIEVGATKGDEDQTITGLGTHTISGNTETIVITVKAQDGSEKTYTIVVKKADSSTIFLDTLSVDDHTLNPTFDKDTLNYTIEGVTESTNTLTINATSSTPGAVISYELDTNGATNNHIIDISSVETGTIKVHITADGTTKTYKLSFDKNDGDTGLNKITSAKKEDGVTDIHTITNGTSEDPNGYIMTGRPQLLASDFKNEFINEYSELHIYDKDGLEINDTDIIKTGMTIKLIRSSSEKDSKLIVIKGDPTGDGTVNIADAFRINNHQLGTEPLTDAYLVAGDASGDGITNIADAFRINNHQLGTEPLW